jgi:hypothetical protein
MRIARVGNGTDSRRMDRMCALTRWHHVSGLRTIPNYLSGRASVGDGCLRKQGR